MSLILIFVEKMFGTISSFAASNNSYGDASNVRFPRTLVMDGTRGVI